MPVPHTPLLAVDVIIELVDCEQRPIVLIERKNPPPGWALPGGFVDIGETVETTGIREAREETGLAIELTHLLGVYSEPSRDPRGHSVSIVYVARASGVPQAQDDAKNVALFELDTWPRELAFDHARILDDYSRYRRARDGDATA